MWTCWTASYRHCQSYGSHQNVRIYFVLHIMYCIIVMYNSIATDVIKSKLETAKVMGADVVVDGTQQSLQEVGK